MGEVGLGLRLDLAGLPGLPGDRGRPTPTRRSPPRWPACSASWASPRRTCSATPRRGSAWLFLAAMLVLALATLPVIGIGVISYTPYLAMLSALELPSPSWKWAVGFWAAGPAPVAARDRRLPHLLLPHAAGRSWSAASCCGIFDEREQLAYEAKGAHAPGRRARAGRPRRARRAGPLADRAVGQGGARRPADRPRPRAGQGGAGVDPGHGPPGTRRGARHRRRPARRQPRGRARRRAARAGRRRRRRRTVVGERRRHRPAPPGADGLGAARVGHQRRTPRAGAVGRRSSSARDGIAVTDDGAGCTGAEGNGLRGMRERVSGAGGTLDVTRRHARGPGSEVALP